MASLTDRVAIVSGGGDGIGRATALLLSQEGAKVVVADVATDAARRVAEEITRQKRDALPLTTDATQKESVEKMVQECLRQWGRIDILVNIVGGSFPMPVMEMEEVEWERVVNLNLKSVYLCCRGVLPAMAGRRYGRIVNLASAQAFTGSEMRANYTAAKLGVVGFSKSLALEVVRLGITVNVVSPGLWWPPTECAHDSRKRNGKKRIPPDRWAERFCLKRSPARFFSSSRTARPP